MRCNRDLADPKLSFVVVVRTRSMDQFPSENLPPELDELGKRMSDERPVASNHTLDRVMTRAQGARRTRKSFMWRSSAPRTPRKTIAFAITALLATGGVAATANAGLLDGLLGGNIPLISALVQGGDQSSKKASCDTLGTVSAVANLGDCSSKKGANCNGIGSLVGASVNAGDCSSDSKAANCTSAGNLLALGVNLGDCSNARADSDAAAVEYSTEASTSCTSHALIQLEINLGKC